MDRIYKHLQQVDGSHLVQEVRAGVARRIVAADHPTYLAWLAAGGEPVVVPYVAPAGPTLVDAKTTKLADIQAKKSAVLEQGFLVNNVRFDSDASARVAYLEVALKLQSTPTYSASWKASLGNWVTMDATLFAAVEAAGAAHIQAVFDRQKVLDAALDAFTEDTAANVAAVQELDISTGWPA